LFYFFQDANFQQVFSKLSGLILSESVIISTIYVHLLNMRHHHHQIPFSQKSCDG